jgi:hypothetical protein
MKPRHWAGASSCIQLVCHRRMPPEQGRSSVAHSPSMRATAFDLRRRAGLLVTAGNWSRLNPRHLLVGDPYHSSVVGWYCEAGETVTAACLRVRQAIPERKRLRLLQQTGHASPESGGRATRCLTPGSSHLKEPTSTAGSAVRNRCSLRSVTCSDVAGKKA